MKKHLAFLTAIACGLTLCVGTMRVTAADFPVLLKRVPREVNVLVLVDIDRLLATPMAQDQGWKKKLSPEAPQRPLFLPPGVHKLVRTMSVDLNDQSTTFEITLLEMPKGKTIEKLAEKHQGYVETISNNKVAWLPKGAYCVKLTDELFGAMFPANRQFLSRWLREGTSGQASTYLSDAAREMKPKGPQIILAIDLEDALDTSALEARLKDLTSLGDSKENLAAIAKVLEGIRGARLSVTIDKGAKASLLVNFDRDVAPLKAVAKPLILEIMGNRGLSLDEAHDWQVKTDGRQLTFEGDLTESGLMRLSSIFELPTDLIDDPEENTDAANPVLYATQAHYKTVQRLTDDLFAKKKQSFGQYAQWAEQYAQKIDRLPLLNVDKDMQAYSADIANVLRGGALDFKGVGIRSGSQTSQLSGGSYVTYDYYGWRSYDTTAQKRAIRGRERAKGAMDAAQMKQQIDQASAAIRKVMVERYKVEF